MSWKLFLDDEREPYDSTWETARTVNEAISKINARGMPSVMSLDHDLGEAERGMDFVDWMIRKDYEHDGKFIPDKLEIIIHSANPVGAMQMSKVLKRHAERTGKSLSITVRPYLFGKHLQT